MLPHLLGDENLLAQQFVYESQSVQDYLRSFGRLYGAEIIPKRFVIFIADATAPIYAEYIS